MTREYWSDARPDDPRGLLDGPPLRRVDWPVLRCPCGRPVPPSSLDGWQCAECDSEPEAAA